MALCLAALSGQAPQPRSGGPKAQGWTPGPNDNSAGRDDAQKLAATYCPLLMFDLPKVTALSSRFDVSYARGSAPANPAQPSLPVDCETGRPVVRRTWGLGFTLGLHA
jgi:hypothetical protein